MKKDTFNLLQYPNYFISNACYKDHQIHRIRKINNIVLKKLTPNTIYQLNGYNWKVCVCVCDIHNTPIVNIELTLHDDC